MSRICFSLGIILLNLGTLVSVQAQSSPIDGNFSAVGHSFYENFGVSWGIQGNGWFAGFGGPPGVPPPFGGFDPASQGQIGGGIRGNGFSGFLNLSAGQGSDTFLGSQSASIVVPNGGFGMISDTIQRPFVLGFNPVVGGQPVSPVKQALSQLQSGGGLPNLRGESSGGRAAPAVPSGGAADGPSTAERGDASVASIRARQAAEDAERIAEVEGLVSQAERSEAAGKKGLARIYYRQAARKAAGSRQAELEAKVQSLEKP